MGNGAPVLMFQTLVLAWAIFECAAHLRVEGAAGKAHVLPVLLSVNRNINDHAVMVTKVPTRRQLFEPTTLRKSRDCDPPCDGFMAFMPDCCDGVCVSFQSDWANCGRCNHLCRGGEKCCFGNCVDVYTDAKNCGFCGKDCGRSRQCKGGFCSYNDKF